MNDSIVKTLGVAFVICLVCSLVVSSTAVSLRDMQNENKANDKRTKILQAAGIFNPNKDIKDQFNQLEAKYINFNNKPVLKQPPSLLQHNHGHCDSQIQYHCH